MTNPISPASQPVPAAFFPPSQADGTLTSAGFRLGDRGTHSSRTMMLAELTTLLDAVPPTAPTHAYAGAVIADNCLGKPTAATRRSSLQRLKELYALDRRVPVFAALRHFWACDPQSRPLLALLAALARDPLLRHTVAPILSLARGDQLLRGSLEAALAEATGDRLSAATLAKVARNAASTWTQSGHLAGRTFKHRRHAAPSPATAASAIYLATLAGFAGRSIWSCGWLAVLDLPPAGARDLALEAHRRGLLGLRTVADLPEFLFPNLTARHSL